MKAERYRLVFLDNGLVSIAEKNLKMSWRLYVQVPTETRTCTYRVWPVGATDVMYTFHILVDKLFLT